MGPDILLERESEFNLFLESINLRKYLLSNDPHPQSFGKITNGQLTFGSCI